MEANNQYKKKHITDLSQGKQDKIIDRLKWIKANNLLSIITSVALPYIVFFVLILGFTTGAYNFAFWHPLPFIAYFAAIYFGMLRDFTKKHTIIYFSVVGVLSLLYFTVLL